MPKSRVKIPLPTYCVGSVTVEDIFRRLSENGRDVDEDFLRRVLAYAEEQHGEQRRLSGEPFLVHPLHVAYILADLRFDPVSVAVGFLHDVLEDTAATQEAIEERFGREIANLVDAVTKIGRHNYVRRDQAQAESFRKMILASVEDIRVVVVKLADRLHNMATLEHMAADDRRRISRETLEIYAPIAHRLGMARVRGDLEDQAFYHLYPRQFSELHQALREKIELGRKATEKIRSRLEEQLAAADIEASISYRVKRYYSIYQKLRHQGIDISELYDYLAFRIVTRSLPDTYAALGVVHQGWSPIPGRFKDYIAMPKPNLYQSLHTTLVGDEGQPFEVQIRTQEMDRVAEEGIAAHWRYKEGHAGPAEADRNIVWLRQLVEWQQDVTDPRTFLNSLKIDLYPDEVYAFTPRGDVRSFPRGATPVDFAFRIHTDLGIHCSGARVNGKLVPLRAPLSNGDIVEILSDPDRHPEREWLSFVVTSRAKSKIRQWLNTRQEVRAVEIGHRLLERALERHGCSPRRVLGGEELEAFLQSQGLDGVEELYRRVGFGRIPVAQVLRGVLSERQLDHLAAPPGKMEKAVRKWLPFGARAISVRGEGDHHAYLAQCCQPLPGDEIVGYLTRSRGVSVHSVSCANVCNLLYNPEREVEVRWARRIESAFPITLVIETRDQKGMLARLTDVMSREAGNIRRFEATTQEPGRGLIEVVVEVADRRDLDRLLGAVGALEGVSRVDRKVSGERREVRGG